MTEIQSRTIRTACGLCPCTCGLAVQVSNGTITRITPADFPDPNAKGACEKGLLAHRWANQRDRLRYPLKRTGKRGEGYWQRVSWDQALDEIATKFLNIAHAYGPHSIAWSIIDYPTLKQREYLRLLKLSRGTFIENWGFGDLAAPNADFVTLGNVFGAVYAAAVPDPKFAIVWGANPADTKPPLMRAIADSGKRGCKIVTIDPRFTATASQCDRHIGIRPGTDGALALAMINVILAKGLEDREFIIKNTVGPLLVRKDNGLFLKDHDSRKETAADNYLIWDENSCSARHCNTSPIKPALQGEYLVDGTVCRPAFQLLAEMVQNYPPENVSLLTDIPAETIEHLAMDYASLKPAALHRGYGLQRTFYGDLACRALHALTAVTGNLNLDFASCAHNFLLMLGGSYRGGDFNRIPIMGLYDAIANESPFAVKALCCAGHNLVNQMPDIHRITEKLFPQLELILTCDLFMNATARYSDYVLPAASFLESSDIVGFPSSFVQLQEKVMEPFHESRSDYWIARELGRRMGFGEQFAKSEEETIKELLAHVYSEEEGITLDALRKGPLAQRKRKLPLATSTGRIEFYVESLKHCGQELPVYIEPLESIRQEKAKRYPLSLITPHPRYRVNSSLANVPELRKFDPEPCLEMNPADAAARNIGPGDMVTVFNDLDRVKVNVNVTPGIQAGVVSLAQGWWPDDYAEGHHNGLTHAEINPVQESLLGPNAAYNDILVEVQKV